jgi:CBS domain-containing protein
MTAGPAAVGLDADVHEVAATMFELGCHHLPVVDDDGERVLGMVSIRDLLGTTFRFAERS